MSDAPQKVDSVSIEERLKDILTRSFRNGSNGKHTEKVSVPERFAITDNALEVFKRRYALEKENGEIEEPEEALRRVADALAGVEKDYGKSEAEVKEIADEFYSVMMRKEFTPAGRTLTNAGADTPVVANCIVLNVQDSMESIFGTLKDASLLQQAGSGLGFPLHLMRPAGSNTKRSKGQASGPISFLRVFDQAFGVIKQQNRHGANMAVMRVDHPDILEFVHCKKKEGDIKNFNISVGLTDKFMQAVKDNDPNPWFCEWKDQKIKPRRITRAGGETAIEIEEVTMTARELFEEIVDAAWNNGEPGCVFLDEVNKTNPIPGLGRIEACNPCGEQFLHDSDVCNLGSIVLEQFVTKDRTIDFDRLRQVTRTATRLLDNVVDISNFPAERVNKTAKSNRRFGLGIMGFADMLLKLRIPYNSPEGRQVAEEVMGTIQEESFKMSQELAEEKCSFPNYDLSIYKEQGIKMRNAARTTIAPTGTIAMFFDVSGGVEPYFALAYHYKGILGGKTELQYVNKHLKDALEEAGVYSKELMDKIIEKGSLQDIKEIPEDIKRVFTVAMDISPEDHTRMQAAFQRHVDNSISKTINFKQDATKEDVLQGYLLAWELRCKGCTVYRDKSRDLQVLNLNDSKTKETVKEKATASTALAGSPTLTPRTRPDVMVGRTYKMPTPYGNLYITVNNDENNSPFEVFATIGKTGGFFATQTESLCRLISLALSTGVKPEEIIKQLQGIRGPDIFWHEGGQVLSLPDAIAKVLARHIKGDQPQLDLHYESGVGEQKKVAPSAAGTAEAATKVEFGFTSQEVVAKTERSENPTTAYTKKPISIADLGHAPVCPDCSARLNFTEGCMKCMSCGFSKCG
ncbi:MAG: adenosylcobalamin-dependent ribonucleoside-diphosphate reductase [Patescibacteria group bacterium]|jgi:ribonucleoside-diphosphate reductase alpha chain